MDWSDSDWQRLERLRAGYLAAGEGGAAGGGAAQKHGAAADRGAARKHGAAADRGGAQKYGGAQKHGAAVDHGAAQKQSGAENFSAAGGPVWRDRTDLELYEQSFAQRIAWKWDAVLAELRRRGFEPPPGAVLDYGCGTGIAARRFGAAFASTTASESPRELVLYDRSALAADYARERCAAELPAWRARVSTRAPEAEQAPAVLLVSHVLGELPANARAELARLAARSSCVIWVEPGARAIARELSALRETLRAGHEFLAPCPHQEACGALAPGREADWCHHFARPPRAVFQTRAWTLFAQRLGIDLRSLPYAYFACVRRETSEQRHETLATHAAVRELWPEPSAELPEFGRVLGRPRLLKGRAELQACTRAGLVDLRLLQRVAPALHKRMGDAAGERFLWRWRASNGRIEAVETLD
jgi:hypothetical protein